MWLRAALQCRPLLFLFIFFSIASATQSSVYETGDQHVLHPTSTAEILPDDAVEASTAVNGLRSIHSALQVMQAEYFSLWLGKWTEAIDWTAAVMNTHLSAALSSMSRALPYTTTPDAKAQKLDNEINKYFGQSTAYYFGEDYFAIRMQAFDDMLWVVLGWLESIQFISSHSEVHYPPNKPEGTAWWHGRQFIPPFAHRARVFWELAEKGWDWVLCGGGMNWNPKLLPYKNAITNELFISASVGMYLHFPGDDNDSPFMGVKKPDSDPKKLKAHEHVNTISTAQPSTYDPTYLAAAINGYIWLSNINMTNAQGLYVDGYHISGYETNHSRTECDERNEMVYTYNQGVILSGLRGLWEATGNLTYLQDGHELVRNVIAATGWTDADITLAAAGAFARKQTPKLYSGPEPLEGWAGLGADGILTELCDPNGDCSQDGQTFKGIFFHHLVAFCMALPLEPVTPGKTYAATPAEAALHQQSCNEYTPWVVHNAEAALTTRDENGRFGMWWGAGNASKVFPRSEMLERRVRLLPLDAVDSRNTPSYSSEAMDLRSAQREGDLNDRGRGRTIETQGGGLAVVRAMWEFLRRYEEA
ncbi:Six-hairpin glycosidase [Byssothecium circinans]|uniref:Six-hairpin glycosidase n=1 Tax=Byssothecium circinans TaxID=147558 RepID=A0A6A5TSJ8_9PLEO|nr:Six-hairpin glycosidase [Byssothecium circinans]